MRFSKYLELLARIRPSPPSNSPRSAPPRCPPPHLHPARDAVAGADLRDFILRLSRQDGFRSRIKLADAEYFSLSRRDEAEARAAPTRPAPSVKQAKRALVLMPKSTPREMRDKAIFALLCLTGIRVAALVSLRIKHVDLTEKSVTQNWSCHAYVPVSQLI
ncbi:MAG: integrase [Paracoccaceae bacterium]|jgi:integrase